MGAQKARNFGASKARADLIAFLDSDDVLLEHSISKRVTYFRKNPDCECSYSNFEICFVGKRKHYIKQIMFKPDHSDGEYLYMLKRLALAPTSVLMAKKDVFHAIGGMDEDLPASHDDDIYLRFSKRGGLHCIPIKAIRFFNHLRTRVSSNQLRVAQGRAMLIEKYWEDIIHYAGSKTLKRHLISNSVDFFLARCYKACIVQFKKAKRYATFPYLLWFNILMHRLILKLGRCIRSVFINTVY